jgi:small conductance mechanosensitive channel
VNVPFSIAYKESIDSAREVALSALVADARVSGHHAPDVVTTKLGDSSVELELRVWVDDPADSVPLRFSLTEGIRKALAKADIEIPFPHLQLFIDGAKGLTDLGPYATTGGNSTISSQ